MASYSPSHLDVIEQRFLALSAGPQAPTVDGAALGCGLPPAEMPLDAVRVLLLKRQTSWVSKDAVWRDLVRRAHETPEPWTVVAAGMMMPGLKHIGGKLGTRYPGERNDLDSEILEGFLQALDLADARQPKIYAQLYWAAFRRAHEACNRETRLAQASTELTETTVGRRRNSGHPDLVLAAAMLAGAVTQHQADLVSDVLLDQDQRSNVARRLGISRHQLANQLEVAGRHLESYLRAETPRPAA